MKHKIAIVLILMAVILLPSCQVATIADTRIVPEGAYDDVTTITMRDGNPYPKTGHIRFALLTDVHVGRENNDPGVYRNHQNFYDFYSTVTEDMPIMLLGDICDNGKKGYFDLVNTFIDEIRATRPEDETPMPIFYIPGNHEFMNTGLEEWNKVFGGREDEGLYTLGAYGVGNLLLENLNTAYRIYTRGQLDAVEENLRKYGDDYAYKLFLSHVPLASEKVDQSLFWFVLADADERNEMLRIMYQYGPSFNMTGHLHEGAQFNEYTATTKEFIFSSFHKRDIQYDNGGLWHIVDIDQDTGDVIIYAFNIDTEGITEANYQDKASEVTRFNMNTVTE